VTIRYVRDGLRIKRLELAADLTALHRRAADAEGEARDVKHRIQKLKQGMLADHERRMAFARTPTAAGEPPPPDLLPSAVLRARKRAGLSQRDLAQGLSISRSVIAEAERGRRLPTPRLARWAAGVLRAAGEEVAS
jgi:ribosome-binding protein aMBF1 (putative translation factor)